MTAQVLLAPFDGTSRVPGTSLGADPLWAALRSAAGAGSRATARRLSLESKSSALWCTMLRGVADAEPVKLAIGGEHLVTFPLLESAAARHPDLRLVVLDAHHDAYDYPLLTHYSLFHYARHELGLPTLIVGARHELDRLPAGCQVVPAEAVRREGIDAVSERVRSFVDGAPGYFSVDVDVVDPGELPGVSDPVPGGLSVAELARLARAVFALAPVGADVVEYNPLRDPEGAGLARLRPFLQEVATWLG